jgi:hypothetical protein
MWRKIPSELHSMLAAVASLPPSVLMAIRGAWMSTLPVVASLLPVVLISVNLHICVLYEKPLNLLLQEVRYRWWYNVIQHMTPILVHHHVTMLEALGSTLKRHPVAGV